MVLAVARHEGGVQSKLTVLLYSGDFTKEDHAIILD